MTQHAAVIPATAGIHLASGISDRETLLRPIAVLPLAWEAVGAQPLPFAVRTVQPAVYILANRMRGTLYIGVTSDLVKRVWQHRQGCVGGFTRCYSVHLLAWFELHPTMECAIRREKALKECKRVWKLRLIEETNPGWGDLYPDILGIPASNGSRHPPG